MGNVKQIIRSVYCEHCDMDTEAIVIERPATYNFKSETFEILEKTLYCPKCDESLYDESLDTLTMSTLTKLYSERMELPLEEIKSIRTQYGLSMEVFSRILGWSKSTVARYESGQYIPSKTHILVLKRLRNTPEAINEFYTQHKHKFSEKEQNRIEEKIKSYDQIYVEKELMNALKINYKTHEKTIESGYNSFHLEKLINMILFFTKNGVLKTKLMKLLFYSDFLSFKRELISISGTPYVRLQHGPVPKDHDLLISTLEKSDFIDVDCDFVNEYTIINIQAKKEFDQSLFNEKELEILKQVTEEFKRYGSVAISDFSHEEDGWKSTENKQVVSYEFAHTLQLD